jgi:hypothetical protein
VPDITPILSFKEYGPVWLMIALIFWAFVWWTRFSYQAMIREKNAEIRRLAEDNHAYRKLFFLKFAGLSDQQIDSITPK